MGKLGKQQKRHWGELLSGLLHLLTYGGSLLLFFALLAIPNWPLRHLSRTSATTLLTWCAMGAAMTAVFGTMSLRQGKKRQRMAGQAIGLLITDAVTYLQLQIMNVNPNNHAHLVLLGEDMAYLLVCVALQMLLLTLTTSFGLRMLPHLETVRPLLLVTEDKRGAATLCEKLEREAGDWQIGQVCSWQDRQLPQHMAQAEGILLAADVPDAQRMELLRTGYAQRKTVMVSPRVQEVLLSAAKPLIVDDAPLLEIRAEGMTLWQRFVKRATDVILSFVLLVILLPVMGLIALAIRLEDGGKAIFRQKRMTVDGRCFLICKFRTMHVACGTESAGTGETERANHSAEVADPRVTRVGRFLRAWRLDELPQLLNILRGDMSLVGPRPEMLENVAQYKQALPEFGYREKMRAGLTGYAQIEGRYNTSPEDKLALDLMYIEGFSLWTDAKLLLRTVTVLFRPDSTQGFPPQMDAEPTTVDANDDKQKE